MIAAAHRLPLVLITLSLVWAAPGLARAADSPPSSSADWPERVADLLLGLETGTRTHADADVLYGQLCAELWPLQERVHHAIRADAPDLIEQHARLRRLYTERSRLFDALSPSLRDELTGPDELGRVELGHEARYLAAMLEYQQHILESALQHLQANVRHTPSATLRGVFRLALLVVVFRVWRRFARKALPQWRKGLLAARPRRRTNLRLAKLLWYFERVRGPVEWLALFWVITLLARPQGFEDLATLISAVVKWLLVGVLAVRIIDAMVARGAAGLRGGNASLRLQSLRLIGGWGILLGLGLDLTDHYAGQGAIQAWVVRGWIALSVPVALVLVRDWRGVIFQKLQEQARLSTTAARLARHSSGFGSYAAATAGGAFLLFDGFVRLGVQLLSGSETGRRIIALLVRREVAREMERDHEGEGEPIADEIILPLAAAREVVIEEVARLELGLLVGSIEAHGGGVSVVVGERGAGKTIFLERIAAALGDSMRVIACPPGGWRAFEQALGDAFGVEPGDASSGEPGADFARRLGEAIEARGVRAIGVDDLQRLPRPARGGQEALVRMAALGEGLGVSVSWVFSVDRHAWRYILRAGAERAMLHDVIELPAWTEEQLAELVARRSAATGLAPDYGRLLLPRQLDAVDYDSVEERNRMGYARVLWELSDGNPAVALYLFAESLHRLADGNVVVRLPQLRSASSLTDAHPDALLVLRCLVRCDVASVDDVARSVRLSPQRVASILRFCHRNQWVVVEEGGYRVSWRWFRSVTRALARKNLMAR